MLEESFAQKNSWYYFRLGYKVCVCLNDGFHLSKAWKREQQLEVALLDQVFNSVVVQNACEILE